MKFLALSQHFQDNVHSLFAGFGFFGGLKPPGDGIFVGFIQRVEKSFCLFVFFKEGEKLLTKNIFRYDRYSAEWTIVDKVA